MSEPTPSRFPAPPEGESWFLSLGPNMRSAAIALSCAVGWSLTALTAQVVNSLPAFSPTLAAAAAALGCMCSLVAMPFLMAGLMHKQIVLGTAIAFTPTLAWVVAARVAWGVDSPMTFWAAAVFAGTCIALRLILPDVWPRYLPWVCQKCNYDLRGVTARQCPECGRPFEGTHALPITPNPTRQSTESLSAPSAPPR